MRNISIRAFPILVVLTLAFSQLFLSGKSYASDLMSRSVVVGSSQVSVSTSHRYSFTLPTVNTLGSYGFEYCSNSPLVTTPCVAPAGLDVSGFSVSAQSGETGFSTHPNTTANRIVISRLPGVNALIPVSYAFNNIVNPSTVNSTIFVRIASYSSADGTGASIDNGTVAFGVTSPVTVNGFVPPYLTFCVGVTVAGDCSSANGQQLNFGELSRTGVKFVTSQFAGATNDPGGFSTTVTGLTMTSGTNVIPALLSPSPSALGVSQFGMNLVANSNPGVGSNPSGIGTSVPTPEYNQANSFVFKNQVVTSSPLPTNFNLFTASYIVNVAASQPPGVYNTTLTYIASAAF